MKYLLMIVLMLAPALALADNDVPPEVISACKPRNSEIGLCEGDGQCAWLRLNCAVPQGTQGAQCDETDPTYCWLGYDAFKAMQDQ